MNIKAHGKTRWRRFGVVAIPTVAATAGISLAIANSALAVSFQTANQAAKITASKLTATGFNQYGAIDGDASNASHPVVVTGLTDAKIYDLCQSVQMNVPVIGKITLKINAGGGNNPATASNMEIDADTIHADKAVLNTAEIGVSKDAMPYGPKPTANEKNSLPGSFGQSAKSVTFTGVRQHSWATQAGTFTLTGLHMGISTSGSGCY